jgi:hypothetical protein
MFVIGGFGADMPDDDLPAGSEPVHLEHSPELQATDGAFKLLSLNSITGFIAMFGWAGLAAYSQYQLPFSLSVLIAGVSGVSVLVITAALFYFAMKLKSPGVEFDINRAAGTMAEVYLQIRPPKTGKISFAQGGIKHEADALSDNGEVINSFEKVKITRIVDSHTVAVAPYTEGKTYEL